MIGLSRALIHRGDPMRSGATSSRTAGAPRHDIFAQRRCDGRRNREWARATSRRCPRTGRGRRRAGASGGWRHRRRLRPARGHRLAGRRVERARVPLAVTHRDLCARLPAAGLAVAVGRGDDPVGREIAVLSAGAVPRDVVRARRMAVVDAQCLRRLAADFRSAVAAVLAAPRPAGRVQFRGQPARRSTP